jgi:soluble lytic murein transglycosylase
MRARLSSARSALITGCAMGLSLLLSPPSRAEQSVPKRAPAFDPSSVAPAANDPVGLAIKALEAGNPQQAVTLLSDPSRVSSEPTVQGRWFWLLGKAELNQANWSKAAHWFSTLANTHHPLSTRARLEHAKLLLTGQPLSAALTASQLRGLKPGGYEAKVLEIRALVNAGAMQEAIDRAEALLSETANNVAAASFLMPLADALASQSSVDHQMRALRYYRRIASRIPLHTIGKAARDKAALVLKKLPEQDRALLSDWSEEESFAEAQAFFSAREYETAEQMFKQLAERFSGAPRCQARFMQARALLQRKARQEGAPLMKRVATECATPAIRPRALFLAAEAFANLNDHRQARILYAKLERDFSTHRLADDARYRSALLLRLDKKEQQAQQLLQSLPQRYPHGDMKSEARFVLAWQAYSRRNYRLAKDHLERLIAEHPNEMHEEGLHGRTQYWLARVWEKLRQRDRAIARYLDLCRRWPLTYYAQLAWARLCHLDAASARKVLKAMNSGSRPKLLFAWKSFMGSDDFKRLLELLRVGEYELAQAEIKQFTSTSQGLDREDLWLMAALLTHAGKQPDAIQFLRHQMKDLWRKPPIGHEYTRWRLAYPLAFKPLIEDEASKQGVPPSLVRAIAREESSFEPTAVSVARAYGLIQLIGPTAKKHAQPLGLPYDPESLKKPEINLPVGIHFLRFLGDRYHSNVAYVPAAYNAGEAAVDRWLSERHGQSVDEWIENIPYSQSRRYSRRVLQTYGIYHWLASQQFPRLFASWPTSKRP